MARIFHQLNDRPCEFVTIESRDGLKLSGRYYHVKDGAPLDIGFHGYRSNPITDFSGGTELSFQMGHNVLLVDERAHGRSDGNTIGFGILERQDLLEWVNYAISRFGDDVKILLYGVSMGGATVLMASALDLPENVKGIIADCPFASPIEIILDVGRKTMPWLPSWLVKPFAILGARIYGGFDLLETDASQEVAVSKVPILIIHGEDDRYVPCEMSNLVSANPQLVERHTFPGAAHGISYLADTPRYHRIVKEFIAKVMP
ncbi:MAG: alpha/beta fold hydrolase [Firmicutes bacterium]|nr:alpha/beta fold hydrolase [Bacillota bacterium]